MTVNFPVKNSPGQNQPGKPMTPAQRAVRRARIIAWIRLIKNYVQTIEARMDYQQSNQPRS